MLTHKFQVISLLNCGKDEREILPLFLGWWGVDMGAGSQPEDKVGGQKAATKTKPFDCPYFSYCY